MIKLTVVMGPDTGNVFLQNDNPIVIGRNNDCDVVLHDGAVSRRHCVIETRGAAFIVSDLRSPNGLFLNDPKNRIDSHVLRNGDEIIFGKSRLRVELPTLAMNDGNTTEAEQGDGSAEAGPPPPLTIDDALPMDSSSAALPSSWQEGMTVFTPRAKLVSDLAPSAQPAGARASMSPKSSAPHVHKSGFFAGMIMGVKKFFSSFRAF